MRRRVEGSTVYLEDDSGRIVLTAHQDGDTVTLHSGDWMLIKDTKADYDHVLARSPAATQCTRFRFYGVTIELCSNIPLITRDFGDIYCRFAEDSDGSADMTIHALSSASDAPHPFTMLMQARPGLRLKGDFCRVSYLTRVEDLLLQVHNESEVFILMNNPEHAFIHAAAVEKDGVGYIMPAESGQGKTTLTLALLTAGFRFMSDEYAVLDFTTKALHAFPRTLSVRTGSLAVFPDLFSRKSEFPRIESLAETLHSIDPVTMMSCDIGEPCPVGHVIFPKYDPVDGPALRTVSRTEALKRLVRTRSYLSLGLLEKQRAMDMILSILSHAGCFELLTADPAKTARLVESLR